MSLPSLQDLHAGLDHLDGALAGDDILGAAEIMAAYDAQLRRYIEDGARSAPVEALRNLLQVQNDLLARMHDRKDLLCREARQTQRVGHASRAYAAVGVAL